MPGWIGADKNPFASSLHPINKDGIAYVEHQMKSTGGPASYTCVRFFWNGRRLARAKYDRQTGKLTLIKDTAPDDQSRVFDNLQQFVDFVLNA
jgi:hypothetical protein